MASYQIWRKLPGTALLFLLNLFTAVALIFEGYNQGAMGSVSATAGFVDMAQIGANGKVINSTKQGGLVAVDYFGAMWGCFIGGWAGDKLGGKKGVWISSLFCMLGAALMCGSQNANMFICARVIAGIGLGFINVIVPLSVSKLPRFTTGARATRSFLLPILSLLSLLTGSTLACETPATNS
ncbi:mfs monosaccharide protein [Lasallia pustulata]|uniref:Mfs monosaccharide protein n=1 Tax=Lasallia pustulata TaxID=136370 RepID=A0A1W5CZ01_9LECA|nr:mfs monosaccharide protein [Lasallia pustulata]